MNIQGKRQYLWRAVDQDGDVIDILVQTRRNRHAAERFFRKLLKGQRAEPNWLVTDNWPATAPLTERPCLQSPTTRGDTRTTEPKSRINRLDSGNDRCAGSSRQARPRTFDDKLTTPRQE